MTYASDSTLSTARAEIDAAGRLVTDPGVLPSAIAVHLRSAWMQLAGDEIDADKALASAKEVLAVHRLDDAHRGVLDWLFDAEDNVAVPPREILLDHVGALRSIAARDAGSRDPIVGWALTFLGVMVLALAGIGIWGVVRGATGPWQVQWFAERDFSANARLEYVREVDFDWGKGSPARGIPKDDWSARFETCLELDDDAIVRFKLTSDDGSRLFVDGEKVVDNWGDHSPRTRTGTRELSAGTYHLQIDYYEAHHGAKLKFEVAFDDAEYGPLSLSKIRQPALDEDAPCD